MSETGVGEASIDGSPAQTQGLPDEYATLRPEQRLAADLDVFKVVSEHFRNDFRMVWEHSHFFVLIQGAFLSVFASLADDGTGRVGTALALIGIFLSLMWWWVVTGRMRLVDAWRMQLVRIDAEVDRLRIYEQMEQRVRRSRVLDSTWVIARFLPPAFILSWVVLLLVAA